MANWIKCTKSDGTPIYVNLDLAATVVQSGETTRIAFPGGPNDVVNVKEKADDIWAKLGRN